MALSSIRFAHRFAAVALSLMAAGAHAQATNLLDNGSFEANSGTTGFCYAGQSCTITDWSAEGPSSFVLINKASGSWGWPSGLSNASNAIDGQYILGLQGGSPGIRQTLTLGAGTYELSWFDANRQGYGSDQTYGVYFNGQELDTFSTVRGQGWQSRSLSFTLAQTTTGTLNLRGLVHADATSFIDDMSLIQTQSGVVAAVPEPETYAMMAACLGVIGLSLRKRR